MTSSCARGDSGDHALEWDAQGGGGVTIPGGIQEMFRCCTKKYSLKGNTGDR